MQAIVASSLEHLIADEGFLEKECCL